MRFPRPALPWFLVVAVAGLASGCAGYRLGPTRSELAGATVQVNYFETKIAEPPRFDAEVNQALRQRIQQDGTFKLGADSDADILLNGSILKYTRIPIAYNLQDTLTPLDYELVVTVHAVARQRASGKVLLDRDVTGRTPIIIGSDQASAERQAMPLLAADVARSVVALLADGDW